MERNSFLDNLKFVLIALVVIGHVWNTYYRYSDSDLLRSFAVTIWLFHIPAFLFVSGLFSKN